MTVKNIIKIEMVLKPQKTVKRVVRLLFWLRHQTGGCSDTILSTEISKMRRPAEVTREQQSWVSNPVNARDHDNLMANLLSFVTPSFT